MTVQYLFENKDILIDFIWKELDEDNSKKIKALLNIDKELASLVDDLTFFSTITSKIELKLLLKNQKNYIVTVLNKKVY